MPPTPRARSGRARVVPSGGDRARADPGRDVGVDGGCQVQRDLAGRIEGAANGAKDALPHGYFPPGGTSAAVAKTLADMGLFSDADLRAIDRDNAVRLLPRFKA